MNRDERTRQIEDGRNRANQIRPPHKEHDSLMHKLLASKASIGLCVTPGAILFPKNEQMPMNCIFEDSDPGALPISIPCRVVAFDQFSITVETIGKTEEDKLRHLVFKHAIRGMTLPHSFVQSARA